MIRSTSLAVVAALAAITLSQTASAQCIPGGPGGALPASGTGGGGAFSTTLPPSPFQQTLAVTIPGGATVLKSVKLNGVTHTWGGDMQFVLENPAGAKFNILCGMGSDPSTDFAGDYEIVDPILLAPSIWATGAVAPSGTYTQDYGTYVSGNSSISNVAIESIPISSGTWTLYAYDWVSSDSGALTSWELCFGLPGNVQPPNSAPTLIAPIGSTIVIPPVNFSWSNVLGATTYDLELDGNLTTGIVSSPYAVPTLAAGAHTWRVRGVNGVGNGPWSSIENFGVPPPLPTLNCLAGGAPGAAFPASGSIDGTFGSILPTGELTSSATITIPPGNTIAAVKLIGLTHTWNTDVMVVLQDPAGTNHLILQRDNAFLCGGCPDDFSGDYTITSYASPVFPTCGVGTIPSGTYLQDFGIWPNGGAGLQNTPIASIPALSGTWTLKVYDTCTAADFGFLTSWELCVTGPVAPVAYCTAGTTTNGCAAAISANANPSVSLANACNISVTNVEGQKSGLIFYSITGQAAVAWNASSFLCVKAPTQRTGTQTSGGTVNTCTGNLSLDWNAFQTANPGSLGNPWSAGDTVQVQAWFRDPPAGKATNLSNAVELTYVP